MIKKLLSCVLMASAVASLSSCLKDNEEEVRYYNDTAVTSFAITTVNKYTHTIAKDGVTDSVYKSSYDAKHHSFYIDQVRKLVYNPDSLPCGVDASKAICAIATKNGGAVMLMMASKTGKDSIVYYNPKDSLDLTRVHKLRVYNTNASAYREYALKVNVHRQTGEELTWSHSGAENLAGVSGRRLVTRRGDVFLFGVKDGKTKVWKGVNGNFQQLDATFSGSAYKNVVAMGDYLYLLDEGKLTRSADGTSWHKVGVGAQLERLIGASDKKMYALMADGIVVSDNEGSTWKVATLDDSPDNLPTENVNFIVVASNINRQTYNLFIIGTRDGKTKIWRKVEENAKNSQEQPWAYYPPDDYNKLELPALANLQVIGYDGGLLALGGHFNKFYFSRDEGLTWLGKKVYDLPKTFGKSAQPFSMARDDKNIIYITKDGEPTVWNGRLARLGWEQNQTEFTK